MDDLESPEEAREELIEKRRQGELDKEVSVY